jgi:hypothetical protein
LLESIANTARQQFRQDEVPDKQLNQQRNIPEQLDMAVAIRTKTLFGTVRSTPISAPSKSAISQALSDKPMVILKPENIQPRYTSSPTAVGCRNTSQFH